ncbi:MAG: DNA mismatch endonuclease Vsr [Reyranella sp.]|uniref:very short patch repair endonuclease n=1 Tax=Reyranella sp. TaxID=1929291 RepID=UPI0011FA733D|nr:very short patch repair endonuclease [Reyranella sp.]TAJ40180.1 MAG: DNA mismatch endonuclease Vsr [Reyranella sp.]
MRSSESRSRNMQAVRGKNTKPELVVRKAAHSLGLRFRLHRSDLLGRPDLTFPKWQTVLFVNGCFWHQHANCARSKLPKGNKEFWSTKLTRNVERDRRNYRLLEEQGWRVVVIWECDLHRSGAIGLLEKHFIRSSI